MCAVRTSGAYTSMNLREFCGTSNVQPVPKQNTPRLPRAGTNLAKASYTLVGS
jgi:hypothetical protein